MHRLSGDGGRGGGPKGRRAERAIEIRRGKATKEARVGKKREIEEGTRRGRAETAIKRAGGTGEIEAARNKYSVEYSIEKRAEEALLNHQLK